MEGSGKYGLGHENRIFDNPPFTLERKKKRKNVSKAMKIDIRDARIMGHVGSEKKRNHQENTTTCLYKIAQLSSVVYSWPPAFLDFAAPAFSYPFLHLHRPESGSCMHRISTSLQPGRSSLTPLSPTWRLPRRSAERKGKT